MYQFDTKIFTLLLAIPILACSSASEQYSTPYGLVHVDYLNYDSIVWYPVTSFTKPNHITNHKSLQSTLCSSMSLANQYLQIRLSKCYEVEQKDCGFVSQCFIAHSQKSTLGHILPNTLAVFVRRQLNGYVQERRSPATPAIPRFTLTVWACLLDTYENLNRSDVSWICTTCNMSNYSSSQIHMCPLTLRTDSKCCQV